jgi:hypothetical protein
MLDRSGSSRLSRWLYRRFVLRRVTEQIRPLYSRLEFLEGTMSTITEQIKAYVDQVADNQTALGLALANINCDIDVLNNTIQVLQNEITNYSIPIGDTAAVLLASLVTQSSKLVARAQALDARVPAPPAAVVTPESEPATPVVSSDTDAEPDIDDDPTPEIPGAEPVG